MRCEFVEQSVRHRVERVNFAKDVQLPQAPGDQLGDLTAEIYDQQRVMALLQGVLDKVCHGD